MRQDRRGELLHVVGRRRSRDRRGPRRPARRAAARARRAGSRRASAAGTRASRWRAPRCSRRRRRRRGRRGRRRERRADRPHRRRRAPRRAGPPLRNRSSMRASSSAPGYPMRRQSRKRSTCASGSGKVPFSSTGFCVASTSERLRQRVRRAVDGDAALLHRLEERRLRARRRAVDLVREDDVGEQRPRAELELPGLLVEDQRAGDVGGQKVGRALDPRRTHRPSAADTVRTSSVLATPGTSSRSTCPSASRATMSRRVWSALPTMTRPTCSSIARPNSAAVIPAPDAPASRSTADLRRWLFVRLYTGRRWRARSSPDSVPSCGRKRRHPRRTPRVRHPRWMPRGWIRVREGQTRELRGGTS